MFQDLEKHELRLLTAALAHSINEHENRIVVAEQNIQSFHDIVWKRILQLDLETLRMMHNQAFAEMDRRNRG